MPFLIKSLTSESTQLSFHVKVSFQFSKILSNIHLFKRTFRESHSLGRGLVLQQLFEVETVHPVAQWRSRKQTLGTTQRSWITSYVSLLFESHSEKQNWVWKITPCHKFTLPNHRVTSLFTSSSLHYYQNLYHNVAIIFSLSRFLRAEGHSLAPVSPFKESLPLCW